MHNGFHSYWDITHYHEQGLRCLYPSQHFLLFSWIMTVSLTEVWLDLIVVLLCISLSANKVEFAIIFFLVYCHFTFENCLLTSLTYSRLYCLVSNISAICILEILVWSDAELAKIFSYSESVPFFTNYQFI